MEEVWKVINGSGGKYKISNTGKVWSRRSNREMSLNPNTYGYIVKSVLLNGKRVGIGVHRLVGIHFLENPDNLPEINHKDANKANNNVWNLEWCEHQHNMTHVSENALHPLCRMVCIVNDDGEIERIFKSINLASKKLSINSGSVAHSCDGISQSSHGIKIRYYDEQNNSYTKTLFDYGKEYVCTRNQKIMCNETGQSFKSQMEAGKILKLSQPQISEHLRGKISDVHGYTFEKLQ